VWSVSFLALLLALPAIAGEGVSFDPAACDLVLDPGDTKTVQVTVTIPGRTSFDKLDAYFLADNTGSMALIIADVRDEARDLLTSIFTGIEPNLRVSVGRYRDFPFDEFAFDHQLSLGNTMAQVEAAIDDWDAVNGFDGSEGQLYALNQIASAPGIVWRPGAKRVLFWFGTLRATTPSAPTSPASRRPSPRRR